MKRSQFILSPLALLFASLKAQEEPKWVPQCWCGLANDDVQFVGEADGAKMYRCTDRHYFSEPWEIKNDQSQGQ